MKNNHLTDFYFSKQAYDALFSPFDDFCTLKAKINGKWIRYTEQIEHGNKPLSEWEDLLFIGSGYEFK
jgi:hypothetical protein